MSWFANLCDNPPCVNPWHFQTGTYADKMRDMVQRSRAATGERNSMARLTAADVRRLRDIAARGDARDLPDYAKQLGVHPDTVRFAIAGRTWVNLQ